MSSPHSSPHAPHRHERPLLANEGTIQGILLAHHNLRRYWVLLHAAKLGHGTDSFTSPPKEGMRRIFQMPEKNPTTSAGFELANSDRYKKLVAFVTESHRQQGAKFETRFEFI